MSSIYSAFGKTEIDVDISLKGSYRLNSDQFAKGVHDPVYIRWAIFKSEDTLICIISFDLVGISIEQNERWKLILSQTLKLNKECFILTCTHTHNSINFLDEFKQYDHKLEDKLLSDLKNGLLLSLKQLMPAKLSWKSVNYELSINRHNPKRGLIDPEICVLSVNSVKGKRIGTLLNYSAHATTAMGKDDLISADYPGELLTLIEKEWGGVGLFLQGAAGNINLEIGERNYQKMKEHAFKMYVRIKDSEGSHPEACPSVKLRNYHIDACVRDDPPNHLNDKRDFSCQSNLCKLRDQNRDIKTKESFNLERYDRIRSKFLMRFPKQTIRADWSIVKIGAKTLVFASGEWFVEYALKLKEEFSDHLWVGYSHGYIGYIPTAVCWSEGYMKEIAWVFNFLQKGEGDVLYKKLKDKLLQED